MELLEGGLELLAGNLQRGFHSFQAHDCVWDVNDAEAARFQVGKEFLPR